MPADRPHDVASVTADQLERAKRDLQASLALAPMNDLDADYTPRYIRLARLLRGRIEEGTYPPGSLLPSSARLADAHAVSKMTARHALEVLVKSGHARHVESKPHQVIWRPAEPYALQFSHGLLPEPGHHEARGGGLMPPAGS